MKKYIAIILALVMILTLVACGDKNKPSSGPEGIFENTKISKNDEDGFQPVDEFTGYGRMIFSADGTGRWEYALETDITWKLKGDKLTIVETYDEQNETYKGTWDGENVIINVWGYDYLFEKISGGGAALNTDPTESTNSTAPIDQANLGRYVGTGSEMQGTRLDPSGEWLELNGDGTGTWFLGATEDSFMWTIDGTEINFVLDVGLQYQATIDGDEMTLDTGMLYYFAKEGSAAAGGVTDQPTEPTEEPTEEFTEEPTEEPSTSGTVAPAGSIQIPGEWYGVAILSNCVGFDFEEAEFDVWGYVDTDTVGGAYFELYVIGDESENEAPILSMYIDATETTWLTPIIGEEDAWISDYYLSEEDEWDLLTLYNDGALDIYYDYDDGAGATANYRFFVREYKTAWDEAVDPLPPAYADYVANYLQ